MWRSLFYAPIMLQCVKLRFWHIAALAALHHFVAYWMHADNKGVGFDQLGRE